MSNDEANWLHGERIECLSCHQPLYRVDHSPFYDEYFLYCDRCPIRVEVSYYDAVLKQVTQTLSPDQSDAYIALMRAIEARLKPCVCGGTFRYDAPRRCFTCHTPVILDDPANIDLFPWIDYPLPDTPKHTAEELEEEERWMAQFIRAEDKWQDG